MHSIFIKQVLVVVAAAATVSAEYLDKDYYLQNVAPKALARINDYRTQHQGNLTLAQEMTLDLSEKVVKTFSIDDVSSVENICVAAFHDKAECASFMGDGSNDQTTTGGANLTKRAPNCGCSTTGDFCFMRDNSLRCYAGDHNGRCNYHSAGCGQFWLQYCNGYCA